MHHRSEVFGKGPLPIQDKLRLASWGGKKPGTRSGGSGGSGKQTGDGILCSLRWTRFPVQEFFNTNGTVKPPYSITVNVDAITRMRNVFWVDKSAMGPLQDSVVLLNPDPLPAEMWNNGRSQTLGSPSHPAYRFQPSWSMSNSAVCCSSQAANSLTFCAFSSMAKIFFGSAIGSTSSKPEDSTFFGFDCITRIFTSLICKAPSTNAWPRRYRRFGL